MLQVMNGTHVAALIDGKKFFDPCLIMQNSVFAESDFAMTDLDFDVSGRVEVSRKKLNCLNVAWNLDLPNLQVSRSYFEFDILNPFSRVLNDYHFELTRNPSEMFFLRFVNLSTGFLNTVCYLHKSGEWFWTFHPYPSSSYRCEIDANFCNQFQESLGLSFNDFRQTCFDSKLLLNDFNRFRRL